jgi:hypothetical protein
MGVRVNQGGVYVGGRGGAEGVQAAGTTCSELILSLLC